MGLLHSVTYPPPPLSEDTHETGEPAEFIARARHKRETEIFDELHVSRLWLEETIVRGFNPSAGMAAVGYLLAFG